MVLGTHCAVLGLPWGVSPRKPSFLSFLPLPLFLHLPPSFGTLVGMSGRSFNRFLISREVTSGLQVMWVVLGLVVVDQGGTDVCVPPAHLLGCGVRILGCRTQFDTCGGCLPGCLVGAGTCLGATT